MSSTPFHSVPKRLTSLSVHLVPFDIRGYHFSHRKVDGLEGRWKKFLRRLLGGSVFQYYERCLHKSNIKDFGGLAKMQPCTLSLHAKSNDQSYRRSDRKRKQEKGAEQLYEGVEHR